jgi:hypothetical protein
MRLLGEIVGLQTQISSLKIGDAPRRRYDPAALRAVPRLALSEDGVTGLTETSERVPDVHNRTHPASKNRGGTNGISVGFTSHYAAMRTRFGDHLTDGIAGENILVRLPHAATIISEDDLRGNLLIENGDGTARLTDLVVAAPCVEFSRFALRFPDELRPDRTVTEAVQFLGEGMRGFYATYRGEQATIALGNRVYLP